MAYKIDGREGAAWFRVIDEDPETGETVLCLEHRELVDAGYDCWQMVMVGDDTVWHTDASIVHEIADLEYCRSCGQIGCMVNVYE